mgnify:CR=1 FL=1|tara:strand:- start:5182 stop:5664 length:483 start_codon:yes stop_codon:yes gene_type:complete
MRDKLQIDRINAFTIMEVTIVLAIMSLIIGIIATATNRFSEQLKSSSEISQELNQWNAMSSNLWRELYFSDSISTQNNELIIYQKEGEINYRILNQTIIRTLKSNSIDMGVSASAIYSEPNKGASTIIIDFLWKGEVMSLKFYNKPLLANQINSYFENFK